MLFSEQQYYKYYLLAKIGVDTAENEPEVPMWNIKYWMQFVLLILSPGWLLQRNDRTHFRRILLLSVQKAHLQSSQTVSCFVYRGHLTSNSRPISKDNENKDHSDSSAKKIGSSQRVPAASNTRASQVFGQNCSQTEITNYASLNLLARYSNFFIELPTNERGKLR